MVSQSTHLARTNRSAGCAFFKQPAERLVLARCVDCDTMGGAARSEWLAVGAFSQSPALDQDVAPGSRHEALQTVAYPYGLYFRSSESCSHSNEYFAARPLACLLL